MNHSLTRQKQLTTDLNYKLKKINEILYYPKRITNIRSIYLYIIRNFDTLYFTRAEGLLNTMYYKIQRIIDEMNTNQELSQPTANSLALLHKTFRNYKRKYEELYLLLYKLIPSKICNDNKQIIMSYLL